MSDMLSNINYATFDIWHVFSLDWWLQHLAEAYRQNPLHMLTELSLIVLVLWLIFKHDQRREPTDYEKLTLKEQEELIREWQPEPLVPPSISNNAKNKNNKNDDEKYDNNNIGGSYHISSAISSTITCKSTGSLEYINLSSHNYLGMANNEVVKKAALKTIKKYAVGSCGPRGFYGTMDIHLNLERELENYFGRSAIIYADYIGCPASVITAFAKRGDILLIDEGCHFLITQGAILSRSNVIWYKHNDMKSLEMCLQTVSEADSKYNRPLNRRFIVTEGIFHNSGDICKLDTIVKFKESYKYRLIIDDSHAFGTIHGLGTPGYYNISHNNIDMYFAGMDKSLGSTGGFCCGNKEITKHQTLSGAGYVFSASAPPFSCTAARTALLLLKSNSTKYIKQIQDNSILMRKLLSDTANPNSNRWNTGYNNTISPLIHLRFNTSLITDDIAEQYFVKISAILRSKGILIFNSIFLPQEFGISDKTDPKPSLRICVNRLHTKQQLIKSANIIKQLLNAALDKNLDKYKIDNTDNIDNTKSVTGNGPVIDVNINDKLSLNGDDQKLEELGKYVPNPNETEL